MKVVNHPIECIIVYFRISHVPGIWKLDDERGHQGLLLEQEVLDQLQPVQRGKPPRQLRPGAVWAPAALVDRSQR